MGNPQTNRDEFFFFDEDGRQATATLQWHAEKDDETHPITSNNALEVFMCGDESFKNIADDIGRAQKSIDIIAWGFDPAMELERTGAAWPRGTTYGQLLDEAAKRGVQVRLLIWKGGRLDSKVQNNMPGHTGDQRGGSLGDTNWGKDTKASEDQRQHYCFDWWQKALTPNNTGLPKRKDYPLEVCFRAGSTAAQVQASLNRSDSTEDPLSTSDGDYINQANEKNLIENHATHHQKTILIDYAHEDGAHAVGYVMGLNSLTDYWDTPEHAFDDPKREVDWGLKSFTAKTLGKDTPISRDPLHDYVCKIRGPALQGLQQNFASAWKDAKGTPSPIDAITTPPAALYAVAEPGSQVQIVRTQPQEQDKTIKNAYWQAVEFASNYLYIENQYFFYERWVRHLKAKRTAQVEHYKECGGDVSNCNTLHMFCVLPWPEDDGMVPRTFDTVKSLGVADSMTQADLVKTSMQQYQKEKADWDKAAHMRGGDRSPMPTPPSAAILSSQAVQAPLRNPETGELKDLRMKVLMARLTTQNKGLDKIKVKPKPKDDAQQVDVNFRQIYIHSKLMVVDDAFFTLGSANLNVRSMAADSEINIATSDHNEARKLRERVWWQHTRSKECVGGDGKQVASSKAFDKWMKLMKDNKKIVKSGEGLITGFVVPFSDKRQVNFRHG